MSRFLAENWIWIVAPIVIVMVLMVAVVLLTQGNDASPFIYTIF
jgi:ABC-type dipeptide/oligopeptide/nickel transport system permease subunit